MRLKELRKQKKISQESIAQMLNISQRAYSSYELAESEPNIKTLKLLADFYNVSMDYLLGRDFATAKDSFDNEIMDVVSKLDITEKSRVLGYAKGRLEAQKELKDIRIRSGYRG